MSYIPDFRKQALVKFDDEDQNYLLGYRHAMQDAICFFDNGDIFEATEEEEKFLQEAKGCFEDWADMEEIEIVCAMADQEKYFNVEFEDENPPLYIGTKGATENGVSDR